MSTISKKQKKNYSLLSAKKKLLAFIVKIIYNLSVAAVRQRLVVFK